MGSIRQWLSRWLMRTKQASGILRLPLLFVTAVSTMTTALRGTALQNYTVYVIGGFMAGSAVFVWAYDYFEILNLQNREKQDRSDNFVAPGFTMNTLMQGMQLGIVAQAIQEDWGPDRIEEEMQSRTEEQLRAWRDGIDLQSVYDE